MSPRSPSGEVAVPTGSDIDAERMHGRQPTTAPAVPSSGAVHPSASGTDTPHRLLERSFARCLATPAAADDVRVAREAWLGSVVAAVHVILDGGTPEVRVLPLSAPLRRLVSELRLAVCAEVEGAPQSYDPLGLSTLLRAFEALIADAERNAARRFAGQLSDMDAMELVMAVAHDMRSPLASIQFLVDTLRQGHSGPLTPSQARQLLLVHSAAFGLGALTRDLIDLASSGRRLLEPQDRAFSVRECLRGVEDVTRPVAEEKALLFTLEPPRVDLRVGQPSALARVLLNLTTNALKFTEFGGVRVRATESSRSRVVFSVEDTGRGIPPDVLASLFDAFRLRHRTQDYVFSSAGLGLSICQTLVEAMGGMLSVESEVGRGTRFSFELELEPASHEL